MSSLLENLGFGLLPYDEKCIDNQNSSISLSLSQKQLSLLVGKTVSTMENQGPLFKTRVPKEFLLRRRDNQDIYLSAMKGKNGHIVGQPGFEEANTLIVAKECVETIAYEISNQMREKCLTWISNELSKLKQVQDYFNDSLIQFQKSIIDAIKDSEYEKYMIKFKSITEHIDVLDKKQDFIIKNAARRSLYCNIIASHERELFEIFNYFLSELQKQIKTATSIWNIFNCNDPAEQKLIHVFSVLGNVVKYILRVFSWEILLTDAQYNREDLCEYTRIFMDLFGAKFCDIHKEIIKIFNHKKNAIERYLKPFNQNEQKIEQLNKQNADLKEQIKRLSADNYKLSNELYKQEIYQKMLNSDKEIKTKQQSISNNEREIDYLRNENNSNDNQIRLCQDRLKEIDDFMTKVSINQYNEVLLSIEENFPKFSESLLSNVLLCSSKEGAD